MRWLRPFLFAITAPCMAAATFVWTGGAGDGAYTNPANWSGGAAPPNDGSASLVFGNAGAGVIKLPLLLNVGQVRFENTASMPYTFSAGTGSLLTLQSGISSLDGASATFTSNVLINLAGSETFNLGNGTIQIDGTVAGTGDVTKTGAGNLKLTGLNLWTGGMTHTSGTVTVGSFANLGIGTLRLAGGALDLPVQGNVVIPNSVVIQANTRISGAQDQYAVFSGSVTLGASVTLQVSGTSALFFTNSIQETGGSRELRVMGLAPVILSGTSSYTGGTWVDNGAIIFAAPSAVPATGPIRASSLGYVGIGYSGDVQSGLLSRLDNNAFYGIIGFDTSPWQTGPNSVFDKTIDLTGLTHYASIGSHTSARLTGEVKVNQDEDYRFGGGGGTLYLESNLTARGKNLQVVSPFGQPLTLVLRGVNTFSGSANVLYSVLVLDRAGTLQNSTALNLPGPGYVGATENSGFSPNQLIGRMGKISSPEAIVGLDSASASAPRTISDNIDLSDSGRRTDSYYLGTSSQVTLTGSITPTVGDALYLTAVKGGRLVVKSTLGQNIPGVVIGQANSFDPQGGTVELASANSYTGQTRVLGGTLQVSNSGALSTGSVSVADRATLALSDGVTLRNSVLVSPGARLSGTGIFAPTGGLTIGSGGILSPGGLYQIGTLQFGSGLTLGSGSVLELDVKFNSSGYFSDRIAVSNGPLTLTANGSAPIIVSLYSLSSDGDLGLTGFDPTRNYSWVFASAPNIVGFDSSQFTFDTSHFLNSTGSGSFFVSQNGGSLVINFTPVPEPSTVVLYAIGIVAVAAFEIRRRKR